jgi:hypothetical protein
MRTIAYRGASALGVLALFVWAGIVRDVVPYLIGLFVFLAGFNAACFRQCEHHDSWSPEKFRRLSRHGAWTVVFLSAAALVVLWRSSDRPMRQSRLLDIATSASMCVAWPTYVVWYAFAYKKHVEMKRRNANLPEDLDFAEDEQVNAIRSSADE